MKRDLFPLLICIPFEQWNYLHLKQIRKSYTFCRIWPIKYNHTFHTTWLRLCNKHPKKQSWLSAFKNVLPESIWWSTFNDSDPPVLLYIIVTSPSNTMGWVSCLFFMTISYFAFDLKLTTSIDSFHRGMFFIGLKWCQTVWGRCMYALYTNLINSIIS